MDESEVLKFEQQVRPMRLSEAIRIGIKLSPPGDTDKWVDSCGGTCAVAAAYEALFGREGYDFPRDKVRLHYELSNDQWLDLGLSRKYEQTKSREAVADYLESKGY